MRKDRKVVIPEWKEDKGSRRRFIIAFIIATLIQGGLLYSMQGKLQEAIQEAKLREIQLLEEKMKKGKIKFKNPRLKRKIQKMKQEVKKKEENKTAKNEGKGKEEGKGKIDLNKTSLLSKTTSTNLPKPSINLGSGPKLDINVDINPALLSQPSTQVEQLDVSVDISQMNLADIANIQADIELSDEGLADVGVADVVVAVNPGGGASIEDILSQEAVPAISLGGGGIEGGLGGGGGLGIGVDVGGGIGGGIELSGPSLDVEPEVKVEATKPPVSVAPPPTASVGPVNPLQLEGEVANRPIQRKVTPKYPARAKRMGWEGIVVLSFSVDENGNVFNIRVVRSSGYPVLDRAAVNALKQWKFAPKPGVPEEKGRLTVRFTLM